MSTRITRWVIGAPKTVLGVALLLLVLSGIYGAGAMGQLLAGGYSDPNAESSHADRVLADTFDRGGPQIVVKLDAAPGVDMSTDATSVALGRSIVDELETIDYVQKPILSVWEHPTLASSLLSEDKTSTQIVATLDGGEEYAAAQADEIGERLTGERDGISIRVGGEAAVYSEVNSQTASDLLTAEMIAIPITFVILVVVFGGLVAAALPVAIGVLSIIITMALLRVLGTLTDVSVFAINLTTALGLALAIDYTLLLITRYREEVDAGRDRHQAIVVTMSTAGRTVTFSAITVALALASLVIFPMYFLRSFAYAGIGVVAVAALASLIVTPALLVVLGDRVDSLDVRRPVRRLLRLPERTTVPVEQTRWYRMGTFAMRHAVVVGAAVVAFLLLLGSPFLSIKFGFPDDRVLPTTAASHVLQQEIRDDYADDLSSAVTVVVEQGPQGVAAADLADYSARLSQIIDVEAVNGPAGTFVDGTAVAPGNAADTRDGVSLLTVSTTREPMSDSATDQLTDIRAVAGPADSVVSVTGLTARSADTVDSIYAHLPWVLGAVGIATFILLFLFTGSVVLPIKALVLNILSLSATFGAMVFFFQEGHLGGLGTTATGFLVATMPVLMFCIAFGLSMDYEVFLLGRIREEWLASDGSREANDHAVALGLAKTGRVITAAALIMSIVFAAMAASGVSFMRMFGVGLALAVIMDATLVRMLLVPSFMRLAGRFNWWAPRPLRRLHDKIGLSEG